MAGVLVGILNVNEIIWLKAQHILKANYTPLTYSEMVNIHKEMSPEWPKVYFLSNPR